MEGDMLRKVVLTSLAFITSLGLWPTFVGAQQAPVITDHHGQSEWFYRQRSGRRGIPSGAYLNAMQQRMAMPMSAPGVMASWVSLGPAPITNGYLGSPTSGRVSAIAVDPTDGNTI